MWPLRVDAAPQYQAATATLTVLSPGVTVVSSGSGELRPGASGQTVGDGDRVLTDAGGHATLTFFDGSEVELDGGTEILVKSLMQTGTGGVLTAIAQAGG